MNRFQKIFDAQKALFATGVTRTYEWRVDQLDRMARMIGENERRFQEAMAKEFKTASQECIFETQASMGESQVQKSQLKEWMKPVEAPVPRPPLPVPATMAVSAFDPLSIVMVWPAPKPTRSWLMQRSSAARV